MLTDAMNCSPYGDPKNQEKIERSAKRRSQSALQGRSSTTSALSSASSALLKRNGGASVSALRRDAVMRSVDNLRGERSASSTSKTTAVKTSTTRRSTSDLRTNLNKHI